MKKYERSIYGRGVSSTFFRLLLRQAPYLGNSASLLYSRHTTVAMHAMEYPPPKQKLNF